MDLARRVRPLLVVLSGLVAAACGTVVLAGWCFRLPGLTDFGSRRVPMAPSTALLFVVLGLATAVAARREAPRAAFTWAVLLVTAASAALLVSGLLGYTPSVEHLGLRVEGQVAGLPVGHMSPITAAAFLLVSGGLLAGAGRPGARRRLATALGLVVIAGSGLFLLAYFSGAPLFYGQGLIPPAAPTSAAFLALGAGLVVLSRRDAPMRDEAARLPPLTAAVLLGLFLVLAGGILLAGLSWLRLQDSRFREEAARQLAGIARLKTDELVRWRAERIADGRVLQDNAAFHAIVRSRLDGNADGGRGAELEEWLEGVRRGYGYEQVVLAAPDGSPRVALPPVAQTPLARLRRACPEVLRTRETAFLDLEREGPSGPVRAGVLVPLVDRVSGKPLAAVYLGIDPSEFLFPFISRWPVPSHTAETLLVRREGDAALFLNDLRFAPGSALSLRVPMDRRDVPATWAARGESRTEIGTDYRGKRVLASTRSVPGSAWGLVARVDLEEAYGPLRERLWLTVFLLGGLLAAVAASFVAFWRREVGRAERMRRLAEAEKAWLKDVIERSLNEIYVFDPVTLRFLFANRGAARNLGFSPEELAEKTPVDIKPDFDEPSFRALLEVVRGRPGEVHRFETRHRRKDGSEYPVEIHLQLVETGTGELFLAVVADITERRKAEARIGQLVRIYAVLSNVNQAIVRLRDEEAVCRETCRIAVEDGGFVAAWVGLGADPGGALRRVGSWAGSAAGIGSDLEGKTLAPLAREALRTGRPAVVDGAPEGEGRGRLDGAAAALPIAVDGVPAGALVLLSGERRPFDDAEMRLLEEMALDVGFAIETSRHEKDRAEAETRVARSELRFRTVARLSSDFAYSMRRLAPGGWSVEWITDAFHEITGYGREEILGPEGWLVVVPAEDREAALRELEALEEGGRSTRELRIVTRAGEERWLVDRVEREAGPEPGEARIYGAVRDVTAAKRAESEILRLNATLEERVRERTRELAEANRELEAFAYSVSHDLKTPLRAIDGYSQILLEEHGAALEGEARGYLTKLRGGAQRMAQLIEDLLAYSRVDRRPLREEEIEVADVVRSVLSELQHQLSSTGARVTADLGGLRLRADREGLAIVLRNLLENALKYAGKGSPPRVQIGGEASGDVGRIVVRDHGIGFDMAYHDRIFEVFQRLHRSEDYPGTGIGLALVRRAVERMKGRVWAESAPGDGAAFHVELPLAGRRAGA